MEKNAYLVVREEEKQILSQIVSSSKSEFIVLYGRRRIGKTYLIHEFFKDNPHFFEFFGVKNLSTQLQIANFVSELSVQLNFTGAEKCKNWMEALKLLKECLVKTNTQEKKIIFFDELPWLASRKSGFIQALDYLWNSFLSRRKDIVLIVCGSAAQWMITNIVNHKGGLHNRITQNPIEMRPFNLSETFEYLKYRNLDLNLETVVEIYMVTGGVAFYLDQIKRGESASQFINHNFFSSQGKLRTEFNRLYKSLFDDYEMHVNVVKLLAKHPGGLTYPKIAENLKMKTGGTFSKILEELDKAQFVRFTPKIDNLKKDGIFQLVDEYTLFYLTWVENLGSSFRDTNYWQKQLGKARYYQWIGQAFEALCFKHSEKLLSALGISGLTTSVYGFHNKTTQIDLLIDRSDKTINLCELKYTNMPYEMTESEAEKIKTRKIELLNNLKKKKQIFVTLITPQPAKKNKHYLGVVDLEINIDKLF